jgi:hypothetical protein
MREIYAPDLRKAMIIVTPQKVPYLAAESLVINQKATDIRGSLMLDK